MEEQVAHLVEAGLLGLMAKPEGVSLAKPPEFIPVTEVLDAVRKTGTGDATVPTNAEDPVRAVLRRRDRAVEAALAGQTLRSLVDGP